ncbi:coiled-coil domain-containing protein 157 isoform X2 [Rhineura floridana]|uniref:coiled-coil domain-containing protein 157 isoform X2 n=1 Tax=Rhineura floridana TaxID=261503 RepID=UPI002AC7EDB8|nr:coiled-coil domain-containing protein 157 isoform X2 [Rhineura floridana]
MASLLLNQNCMDSLQKDITDLQGTVISVFSRAGAVRYPSWKFPDKVSCDLDLVALLERYDFAENDPELTHHSHVILLELVIDRLLLLLQSFTRYTENLISEQAVPPSRATGPCMSIGLAVKKYWNSMLKLGAIYQQLAAENHSKEDASSVNSSLQVVKAERLQSCSSEQSESDMTLLSFRSSPLTLSASSRLLDSCPVVPSEAKSPPSVPKPVRSIHCQTVESSLVPCDACERAQVSLREVGSAIINICNSQNLPSSLSRFLKMVEETLGHKPLTAIDISYWASEQSKDLSRINKHLRTLMELINPLKGELEESEKEKDELRRQLETFGSRLQKEKEDQEQVRKEAELSFEKKNAESLQLVATLEKDKEDLQSRAAVFKQNVSALKGKLQLQEGTIQELERAKSDLLQEMRVKMVDKAEASKLEDQLEVLTSQLESAKQQLNWASTELEKEKAKVESMLRHKESLQAKQRALMQQLDNLDQECEQLRTGLADGEEDRYMMKERLKEMQEEKWEIQRQLEAQQKLTEQAQQEKLSLEQSASELRRTISELGDLIQEMKERERLLVSFPDLHIPVETQFESTGNVMEDICKQLQANNIRISILEEENSRLRAAVARVKEAAQQEGPKLLPPTQLWSQSVSRSGYEQTGTYPPTGHPVQAGAQGAALRPPTNPASAESASQNRSRSHRASPRDGSAFRRTLSSQLSKPPSGEAVRKAVFTFACEDPAISAYVRAKGRGRALGHPHRCTRNHQK